MERWTYAPGFPVLNATLGADGRSVMVTQARRGRVALPRPQAAASQAWRRMPGASARARRCCVAFSVCPCNPRPVRVVRMARRARFASAASRASSNRAPRTPARARQRDGAGRRAQAPFTAAGAQRCGAGAGERPPWWVPLAVARGAGAAGARDWHVVDECRLASSVAELGVRWPASGNCRRLPRAAAGGPAMQSALLGVGGR